MSSGNAEREMWGGKSEELEEGLIGMRLSMLL